MFEKKKDNQNKKNYQMSNIQKAVFLLGALVIVFGGVVAVFHSKERAEKEEIENLKKISDVAMAAVNPRRLITLEGNNNDLENPDYQRLKEQMFLMDKSLKNFGMRWIYLMNNRDGKWYFSVDPISEDSPDYTPPGAVYEDYPNELDSILEKKETISVGPYKDQWGEFFSAFSPIKDFESGEVLGILGADVDAKTLKLNVLKSQILPTAIAFFVFLLWILFFIYNSKKIKHEKEIQSRENRFRSMAEKIDDIIYRLDLNKKFTYVSPVAEKMLGFSQEEALGKTFLDFIPASEHAKAIELFKRVSMKENVEPLEILVNRKDGKKIYAEISSAPIKENDKVVEIQGVIRDITQKKENEEKIKKQNEELKKSQIAVLNILEDIRDEKENVSKEKEKIDAILHSIGDGVFVVDKNSKIIMINDVTCKMAGYSSDDLVGKKYSEKLKFVFEKDGSKNEEFIKKAIMTGEIQEMANHTMLIRKDGSKVPVSDSAAPLKNREGEVTGCVIVFRDVTKEREIDQMKSEFVSVASHQLRTPLTSIKWFSELLLENKTKKLSKEQKEFIREISESNQRMISLVNDLLNVSRIETGKNFKVEKKKTDIILLIEDVIKEQAITAEKSGINVICDASHPSKLLLDIDGDKIKQVFQNLISNAIKYSLKGGKVFMGCEDKKQNIIFFVKDSGLGIPIDQQDKIFEKFFRASNVLMTGAEGTGLGLYIARSIIEAHGGKIWFESKEKKGTTFYIELPK